MTTLNRRQFLATLGAAGLATAGTSWFTNRLFAMVQDGSLKVPRGAGVETWVPSLCRLCPAGCGIRVRLVDGLPVGLRGNPNHPASAGGLCPAGLAGLQEFVHPDRARTPLRRDGPRGSGRWTAISWDEALEQIASRLRELRQRGTPQAFAVLERGDSPLTRFWLERVLRAYGSPNLILDGTNEPWHLAWKYVAGIPRPPAVDLTHSDFILSFGHELFETDGHPVWQSKVWGRLRGPAVARPTTLAYVGSRLSTTAARADVLAAIRPGQEATLALGLVHVLILEDLVDRVFLERWTSGYRGPAAAAGAGGPSFEGFVRQRYTPEEVSRRTGVPVSELFRLGRAFGGSRAPVALIGRSPLQGDDGLSIAMAVVALNLAVGAVGRPGGYVAGPDVPLALPAALEPDAVAAAGLASTRVDGAGTATLAAVENSPARIPEQLASSKSSPPGVVLVHGVNPVHEWPGSESLVRALAGVDLVVAMVRVPDETAARADLVLPETSDLESWGLLPSPHGLPFDYAGLQQPALAPLYESRAFEDFWFALARRVGAPVASAVPSGSFADWLPEAAGGLFAAGRGTLAGELYEGRIAEFMEDRGWKVAGPPTAAAFWEALRQTGAWVDMPRAEHSPAEVLGLGVDRFAFWPASLLRDAARSGSPIAPAAIYADVAEATDTAVDAGPADPFPLRLLLFDTNTLWEGRTTLTPLMLELTGHREDIGWDSWVEIHPDTAARHHVEEGDRVRLESAAGAIETRARLTQLVPADAVAMPRGLGHTDFGRFASHVGARPTSLLPARSARWTGVALRTARVRIVPARA